jgi:hypothetical protein
MNPQTFPRFELFQANVAVVCEATDVSFHMSLDVSLVLVFFLANGALPNGATERVFILDYGLCDQVIQLYKKCQSLKFKIQMTFTMNYFLLSKNLFFL